MLQEGVFLKRYKRFFADIKINGEVVTAHVANTGSLKGCLKADVPCLVRFHDNPERKLKYSLEMLKSEKSWVGINTSLPNEMIYQAWKNKAHTPWLQYQGGQKEVKISDSSRIDMILWQEQNGLPIDAKINRDLFSQFKFHFIEIKNVTMAEGEKALFPDAVTERGQKHLVELMSLIDQGHTSEIVFVIQREDCDRFSPADQIDPRYGKLLREAQKKGVIITPLSCLLSTTTVELNLSKSISVLL